MSILIRTISNAQLKSFFLLKYFCGAQLASIQNSWAFLRDNATPSALSPSPFYSSLVQNLRDLRFPTDFSFSAKDFYKVLLTKVSSAPILPRIWGPFVPRRFSLVRHWEHICDNFTENHKNDLAWLITLQAVKVCESLKNWGYIPSAVCASCPRLIAGGLSRCGHTSLLSCPPFYRLHLCLIVRTCFFINFPVLNIGILESFCSSSSQFYMESGSSETKPLSTMENKILKPSFVT